MRGDGCDVETLPDFILETCRVAYELRRPDARQRATRALRAADGTPLAREVRKLLSGHKNRPSATEDAGGPTPETLVHQRRRRRGDTLETLVANGKLEWHQQASAEQICRVYECITAPLWSRNAAWELGRVDSSNGAGSGIPERLADRYTRKFLPWARWMSSPRSLFQSCPACRQVHTFAGRIAVCSCGARRLWRAPPHLPLVLTVAVFGGGIEATATAYRMRRPRALRLLQLGLDRYSDFA